jgi:hypothetical protein
MLVPGKCPSDLDDLDHPVDIGAGGIVYPLPEFPGGEMGQFQVGMGINEPRHDDATGKLPYGGSMGRAHFLQGPDGYDTAISHGYRPAGDRRA